MTQFLEAELLRSILLTFGARRDLRLFRNSVGMVRLPGGRAIPYGLCPGSADLIGWRTIGDSTRGPVAQFVALEAKAPRGHLTPEQARFLEAVRRAGGVAAEVRSLDDVAAALSNRALSNDSPGAP